MPSGIRRIHPHNKGESPRSMERYKKRIKTMAPTQLFTELHDINDEYLGGSAKMRLLIKHLQTGWTNHLTQLRAIMMKDLVSPIEWLPSQASGPGGSHH
jgi:hypothetical protein